MPAALPWGARLFELLKNAMRAVAEAHRGRRGQPPPPIVVRICDAPSSVTLRISDQVRSQPHPPHHRPLRVFTGVFFELEQILFHEMNPS